MTEVTHTPPALRWVALFLAACGVLGLFLGFRDQIRKNPPGWYTGAEQIATPLVGGADGARDAVAFDPNAPQAKSDAAPAATAPAPAAKAEPASDDQADTPDDAETPATTTTPPGPVTTATQPGAPTAAAPKPKPVTPPAAARPAARAAPSDPVGDILEGQKQPEPPATVPY